MDQDFNLEKDYYIDIFIKRYMGGLTYLLGISYEFQNEILQNYLCNISIRVIY